MDFGRVWGRFWEAKIFYFSIFFRAFSMLKFERRFETKNLRKKTNGRGSQSFWAWPAECAGCWGEKRREVQKLAGTEFWKKYLRQACTSDAAKIEKELDVQSSTLVPGGAVDPWSLPDLGFGRFLVDVWSILIEF